MLRWISGFLLGCITLFYLEQPLSIIPLVSLVAGSLLILAVSGVLSKWRQQFNTPPMSLYFSILISVLAVTSGGLLGAAWASYQAESRLESRNNLAYFTDLDVIKIEGLVSSIPHKLERYCSFDVTVKAAWFGLQPTSDLNDEKLSLRWYNAECPFELGSRYILKPQLKTIHGPINNSGFDYERWMFVNDYSGKGYVREFELSEPGDSIRGYLYELLQPFDNSGVLQGLVIGEKQNLSKHDAETIRKLGLSHLMAISGLHIAIIAGFALWFFGFIAGYIMPPLSKFIYRYTNTSINVAPITIAWVASLVAAFIYSALADFSIPTLRALIMWGVIVVTRLSLATTSLPRVLALAALLVLALDPISVLSASFWMTFFAVAIIAFMVVGRKETRSDDYDLPQRQVIQRKIGLKFKQLVKLQVVLSVSLGLLSVLIFGEFSLVSILLNIVAIPLFSFVILPAIFIAVIMLLLGWSLPLVLLDSMLTGFFVLAKNFLETVGWASLSLSLPTEIVVLLISLAVLMIMPLSHLKRPLLGGISAILATAWLVNVSIDKSKDDFVRVKTVDVGHGLATLIYSKDHAVLYDTGYSNVNGSAASSYIIPVLNELGIKRLDALIISHQDNDHSGGMFDILQTIQTDMLVGGRWISKEINPSHTHIPWQRCDENWSLQTDFFSLQAVYPYASNSTDEQQRFEHLSSNNQSCVIKVTTKKQTALLTGDIEVAAELVIAEQHFIHEKEGRLARYELTSDILIAPHHGSNTSSSYPFLKAVNAQHAVFSSELGGRFVMPHPKVLNRYKAFATTLWHTGCAGSIEVNLLDASWQETRQNRPKIWRNKHCKHSNL